ncbi:hypothetical protein V3565_00035 [Bartonella sp. B10]
MNLKCDKKLFVCTVPRKILIMLLLAAVCTFFVLLYYFTQPRAYRATLRFSLSDSVGKPLSINQQHHVIAYLFSQPIIFNYLNFQGLSSNGFDKKNLHENIRLFRDGNLIDLIFEAGTIEAAKQGVENCFSAFSASILKENRKLSSVGQPYDSATLLDIVQKFRSSISSFIHNDIKQTELNDLYVKLTKTTLERIHLTSLKSTIQMMRENKKSLLSLSFIARNPSVVALESKRNILETQKAHMAVQLGVTHPQIKAINAELEALSSQLDNKILQIIHQIYSDEIIAKNFEVQLKKMIGLFVKDQSQPLNQMFNKLENQIKAVVDAQNKEIGKYSPLQNIKIRLVSPPKIMPTSFMALHGKNIVVSMFASLIVFLGGLLLFQQFFGIRKTLLEKDNFENGKDILASRKIKNLDAFITIEGLSDFLKWNASKVISIIGPKAAQTAAKLSLHLIKESKTILLIDISGQQIEKMIGPHRGLSDILMGKARLQDVIYRDHDTGVDILSQGLASVVHAQGFSKNIYDTLQEFKKYYDFVILEMASEPKYGLEQFAQLTDYYICGAVLHEQSWMIDMINRFPKTVYRVVA